MRTPKTDIFKIWGWVGVLLYVILVVRMAFLLFAPGPEDGEIILTFGAMMAFEFILVHSGVTMALSPRNISLFILFPMYGIFALGLNAAIPGNAILFLYFSVVLTRMRFAFSEPNRDATIANIGFSIAAIITYFLLVIIFAVSSENLPHFGITEAYLDSVNYSEIHDSGGVFIDMPHVPIAMGIVYFTLLSFYETFIQTLKPKSPLSS